MKVKLFKRDVVRVDVIAGFDGAAGAADELAIADEIFALRDGLDRDLVTGGNRRAGADALSADIQRGADAQRDAGDGDVVARMELDGRIFRGRKFRNAEKAHVNFYLKSTVSQICSPVWTCNLPLTG